MKGVKFEDDKGDGSEIGKTTEATSNKRESENIESI